MAIKYKMTSHEAFSHDSIDSYGYDWERVGNPNITPKYPFKIYLPQTTEDIVQVINEIRKLGQQLWIRSKGHSSNDLVLTDGGCVLCTEKLNHILELDEKNLTVTVQSGVILAQLDDYLWSKGYGLPVIGDHDHITAGGFASVGGISPASHRYGMFVDTVQKLDYVNWGGTVVNCSKTENPKNFYRLLTGTGRYGVIATLTIRIIHADKYKTVLKNRITHHIRLDKFLEASYKVISNPGNCVMERGVWLDIPIGGINLKFGQFSAYYETSQNWFKRLWNDVAYYVPHTIGLWAGRLPDKIDLIAKYVGMASIMFSPRYATIKNVERFTDKILDSTVGDPTRMFIVLAPQAAYAELLKKLYKLSVDYRKEHKCFTFISIYVKAIHSEYLAQGNPKKRFCEFMLYCGINPERMTQRVLEALASQVDDLCIGNGAFRYMHTKTVKDPERRKRIDPNAFYGGEDNYIIGPPVLSLD